MKKELVDSCGVKESWYKNQIRIQQDMLNTIDKSFIPIFKVVRIDLPPESIELLRSSCQQSIQAMKPNIERLATFPFPENYGSIANFNMGRGMGKNETILKILGGVK